MVSINNMHLDPHFPELLPHFEGNRANKILQRACKQNGGQKKITEHHNVPDNIKQIPLYSLTSMFFLSIPAALVAVTWIPSSSSRVAHATYKVCFWPASCTYRGGSRHLKYSGLELGFVSRKQIKNGGVRVIIIHGAGVGTELPEKKLTNMR